MSRARQREGSHSVLLNLPVRCAATECIDIGESP